MRRFFRKFRRGHRKADISPPVLAVEIPGPRLSIDSPGVVPTSIPPPMSAPPPPISPLVAAPTPPARRMTAPPSVSAFYGGGSSGSSSSSRPNRLRPPIPDVLDRRDGFHTKRKQQEIEEGEEMLRAACEGLMEEEQAQEQGPAVKEEEVVVEEEKKGSKFLELPNELMLAVAELLPIPSISAFLQCNRRFAILLELTLYRAAVKHSGYGKSMFCRCILKGNTRSTLRMLELGADVNRIARSDEGKTPLHYAVKSKNSSIVKAILERPGVKLDVVDTSQTPSTPLSLAVAEGNEEIVNQLLQAGADACKSPVARECYTAINRGRLGVIRSLIDYGLSVNHTDSTGNTLLHFASTFGNVEAVRMLLSYNANVTVANSNGVIPLYRAAEDNYLEVAKLLLPRMRSVGACDVPTRYGSTSLHAAVKKNHIEFAKLLIKHGAGLNVQDGVGDTPLHAAASHGLKDMVELLLEKGARVRIKNRSRIRPSGEAGTMGYTELERILEKAEHDRAQSGAESDDDGDSLSDSMVVSYHVYRNSDGMFPGSSRSAVHSPFL